MNSTKRLFINIGQNAGAAIAPIFIIPLCRHYGWRSAFFVPADRFVWVAYGMPWFKNHPAHERRSEKKENT